MKILFLRSGYGKPDSRLEKEILALSSQGNDINVLAWNRESDQNTQEYFKIGKYDIAYYHIGIKSELAGGFKKNFLPMIKFNIQLYKYIRNIGTNFDVVHANDFDTVIPAYLLRRKKKFRLVYDIYDYYADSHHLPSILDRAVRKVDTKIINHSDAVIICNEKRMQQIEPAKPLNLYVLHNSPENIKVEPDFINYPKTDKLRVVFIGCFADKGRYIKEMIESIKKRCDVELIIGGYGSIEGYVQKQSNQFSNIIYVGKQEYNKVLQIEATADVLTALYDPSLKNHQFAAPNKFYEALMLGKPIICAKNTYIDEIVENNKFGWVLNVPEKGFEVEFNRALDSAIAMKVEEKNIAGRMKRFYLEHYNWDVMKKRLQNLYADL